MSALKTKKGYDPVTIVIYDRKKNVIIEETSLIAFDKTSGKVLAAGKEAASFADSKEDNIVVMCPLRNGVIADYMASLAMFRSILQKASILKSMNRPKMAVCAPGDMTEVEQRAFMDLFCQLSKKEAVLVYESPQEADQTLPSSISVIVGIVQNKNTGTGKEVWREVCKNKIPEGQYKDIIIRNQESGVSIVLEGSTNRVKLTFKIIFGLRMLLKKAITDRLYSEEETKKFSKDHFKNVIYELDNGEFIDLMGDEDSREAKGKDIRHYLIMGEENVIEILAEEEPEIIL